MKEQAIGLLGRRDALKALITAPVAALKVIHAPIKDTFVAAEHAAAQVATAPTTTALAKATVTDGTIRRREFARATAGAVGRLHKHIVPTTKAVGKASCFVLEKTLGILF